MKIEVTPTDKVNNEIQGAFTELPPKNINEQVTKINTEIASDEITELTEDMEMVSPGSMLLEARIALSLSQQHIADRLNFKVSLVQNIEEDHFDPMLPATFNRGYLTNYAKLVGVDAVDVLASYDALDAATIQRSEMLSFSNETTKQAEHSRVMWLSYLIAAVFIGLTIIWWLQESRQQELDTFLAAPTTEIASADEVQNTNESNSSNSIAVNAEKLPVTNDVENTKDKHEIEQGAEPVSSETDESVASSDTILSDSLQAPQPIMSTAIFTFKGDCWVNIFDAKGERIAWGVKRTGYVMPITGEAPLKITVGKPELTSISFNGEPVDMSSFNKGNIAKFNLPFGEYAN